MNTNLDFGSIPDSSGDLVVIIPKGFMNVRITGSQVLLADNNNHTEFDSLEIPLPALESGKWGVKSVIGKKVTLTKYNY